MLQVKILIEIKTHPELNRTAIKHQKDASYLLWCVLSDAVKVSNLSSHYSKESAYETAKSYGLTYSRRNFNRILNDGNYLFWTIGSHKIYLRSFKKVYNALADDSAAAIASSLFVMIQPQKSAAARRAEFYWSWFAVRGEQTVSRDTLRDLFGLSHDQQRDYEKLLGKRLLVKFNHCHIDADLYKNQLKNIPTYAYSFIQERETVDGIETINVIAYQLPNTYIASKTACGESPLRFAPSRALRVTRTLYRLASADSHHERCYFNFYDEWEKHMNSQAYIRTFYQGRKRIYRQGQYF